MLRYLLDEQISPVVAEQLRKKHPNIPIESLHRWRGGELVSTPDEVILLAAARGHATLVTYDQRTIPGLLVNWAEREINHEGVILVDELTIAPGDFGSLIRSLVHFWKQHRNLDWTNRIAYLHPPR